MIGEKGEEKYEVQISNYKIKVSQRDVIFSINNTVV